MPPGTPVEVSVLASAWDLLERGWAAGGLAFILLAIVLALISDTVVSGSRLKKTIVDWQKRYDDDVAKLQKRLDDKERENDMLLNMLLSQQGTFNRGMKAAEVVASAAHEVVTTANAVVPPQNALPPPQEHRRWWQL